MVGKSARNHIVNQFMKFYHRKYILTKKPCLEANTDFISSKIADDATNQEPIVQNVVFQTKLMIFLKFTHRLTEFVIITIFYMFSPHSSIGFISEWHFNKKNILLLISFQLRLIFTYWKVSTNLNFSLHTEALVFTLFLIKKDKIYMASQTMGGQVIFFSLHGNW